MMGRPINTRAKTRIDAGERAVRFLNNLTHTGDYGGEPFRLRPWQEAPIRKLYGTLRPDGLRQCRKTFWGLPRKQGKTELVAGNALYLLLGQGKRNQRIYTAAGDTDQASLIFDAACEMITNDPELDRRVEIHRGLAARKIIYPAGNSLIRVLSSVPKSKHGLGPTAVLIDELHVVEEALVRVLTTGFGARKEPLTWYITTAGDDRQSIAYDEWNYALRVKEGSIHDPTYLPVIHAADLEDDWQSEDSWRKAMPALGDFCDLAFIRDECRKAVERPRYESTFRQLYLNQWCEDTKRRWLSLTDWEDCQSEIDWSEHEGRECYGGLDLSSTRDLSSLVLLFPRNSGGYDLFVRFWAPGASALRREREEKVPYSAWERAGHVKFTGGPVLDHEEVVADIEELSRRFRIAQLGFDPAHSSYVAPRLWNDGAGIDIVKVKQTRYQLSEAAKRFESIILEHALRHDGNPCMTYCVANAVADEKDDMIIFSKGKSRGRIDGVAAGVMATAVAEANAAQGAPSDIAGPIVL